jgi:hypothetical protein
MGGRSRDVTYACKHIGGVRMRWIKPILVPKVASKGSSTTDYLHCHIPLRLPWNVLP